MFDQNNVTKTPASGIVHHAKSTGCQKEDCQPTNVIEDNIPSTPRSQPDQGKVRPNPFKVLAEHFRAELHRRQQC